jgi:serine/threonine-protein kinase HipA
MELSYDPSWISSPESRPLSLSLPINLDGLPIRDERVGFFFDNLLPDSGPIRRRIQQRFHTPNDDAFDLLEAIGRDCAGAIQLLPEGETPEGVFKIETHPLTERDVEKHLLHVVAPASQSDSEEDEIRLSIAGAQEKTAFLWHRGRWCIPRGATPTTHIFKLPLGLVGNRRMDMSNSLENEWLCARILGAYGVPVAHCEVKQFGETKALIVTRFDRRMHSSRRYWLRLPQEDFCQVTGTPSSQKYESDGGPDIVAIARILQASESRDEDLNTLLRAQLLFWMLAATDGHAKNFSIRILPEGRYRLTPLYDILSAWPIAGRRHDQLHPSKLKLALSLRGGKKHYRVAEIRRRHFNITAHQCGLGTDMNSIIDEVITQTASVIDRVGAELPAGYPERVFETITTGLAKSANDLAQQPR